MDYTAINQTSIISAGTTRFEITIPIQNDGAQETSETFEIHISAPNDPTIFVSNTVVQIIDDDGE